jgi:hypothetical protein
VKSIPGSLFGAAQQLANLDSAFPRLCQMAKTLFFLRRPRRLCDYRAHLPFAFNPAPADTDVRAAFSRLLGGDLESPSWARRPLKIRLRLLTACKNRFNFRAINALFIFEAINAKSCSSSAGTNV